MNTNRVLKLRRAVSFRAAAHWEIQARFAVRSVGPEIVLEKGSWLFELGAFDTGWGSGVEYRYRTARGELVASSAPLPQDAASVVRDPEAARAMGGYADMDTLLKGDFGVTFERACSFLPPFDLIRCPLCAGTAFTSLDLASVWCDRCNARFFVRSTAGDPGFVVDISWEHYDPLAAFYLLPRTGKLRSTLVLKDSADPRDLSTEDCEGTCARGALALTDGSSGLRAGLHVCNIGTLYDWRRIYGEVPTPEDLEGNEFWEIDGISWPLSATLRTLMLDHEERDALERARFLLEKDDPSLARSIRSLAQTRRAAPAVFSAALPDPRSLQPDERYVLHHWLTERGASGAGSVEVTLPVWFVVRAEFQEQRLASWRVVARNICPCCAQPVLPGGNEDQRSEGDTSHQACGETWARIGWQPEEIGAA